MPVPITEDERVVSFAMDYLKRMGKLITEFTRNKKRSVTFSRDCSQHKVEFHLWLCVYRLFLKDKHGGGGGKKGV